MRRKIMTAFVCAIMTISVIPVYADDTQTDQAVTTEVSTETAATVQETKRTQKKEQQKKKTTSKKYTKTKKVKSKKKAETNKVVPMPTQVISKSSSDTIEGRIKDKQAKVKQLKKQKAKIQEEIEELGITEPKNLEEQALSLAGRSVYEKLVKGYTEKQWGRDCKDLPAFIIKRLPLRFIYDNNYFNDRFQGIPMGGYTAIVEKMLEGSDVLLNTDYYEFRKENADIAEKTVYTGMLDKYFDYKYGVLEYRSVRFETETLDMDNYQGNAVVNYTEREIPYTRIIEHKHFEYGTQPKTVISREYPSEWKLGEEPYYPVNNEKNEEVAGKYRELADKEENVIFGGRLGEYRYYDMDKVIESALACVAVQMDKINQYKA